MVTTINQMSFVWLILIFVSPYFVVNQGQGSKKDQVLLQYWLSSCFLDGFNLENLTSTNCESLKSVKNVNHVPEFESKCLGYYKLGCALGQKNSFCDFGISKVISDYPRNTNFSCSDMELLEDLENVSFDCCITCKRGLTDATLNDKCIVRNAVNNIADQAQQRCCKAAVSFGKTEVNSTLLQPDLPSTSSGNFTNDEMSRIAMENDLKIDSALAHLGNKIQNDNVTVSTNTSDPSLIANVTSSFDVNNVTSDTPNISTMTFATTTELTTISNETDSVTTESVSESTSKSFNVTSNIEPKEVMITTTTESISLGNPVSNFTYVADSMVCTTGYELVDGSCQDIDECKKFDKCYENETCFNIPGSFKCCSIGTELSTDQDNAYKCVFADYCEKRPCYQSADDQHYCVNSFRERECIDKLTEGYEFFKGNIQKSIDTSNEDVALYLELSQQEILLKSDVEDYRDHGLVKLELPEGINCDWEFGLDKVWSPYRNKSLEIQDDQFKTKYEQNKFFVYINGQVKPQSVAISITCNIKKRAYFRNTIYLTFKPKVT